MPKLLNRPPVWLALFFLLICSLAWLVFLGKQTTASIDGRAYWNPADQDGDGLSDQWEVFYFGSTSSHSGAEDDDLDDLTTLDEYFAGSHPLLLDPKAVGEAKTVSVAQWNRNQWHTARFDGVYVDPVVIMGPADSSGQSPIPMRVASVSATSFDYQIDLFDHQAGTNGSGGLPSPKDVSWMAIESGRHVLGNQLALEAGNDLVVPGGSTITFSESFETKPIVLAQAVSYNGKRSITTRVFNVSQDGFDVLFQAQEDSQQHTAVESLSWVAIEPGFIHDEFSRRQTGVFSGVKGNFRKFQWPSKFKNKTPTVFLASTQTLNEMDTVVVHQKLKTKDKVSLRLYEDKSADSETQHAAEDVAWYASQESGIFHILPTTGDKNADGLPDLWVKKSKLKGGQAGSNGYYGDRDKDGLLNYQEYRYATNPRKKDTDGDGVSDWDEVNFYESDALAGDVGQLAFLRRVAGSTFTKSWGAWERHESLAFSRESGGWIEVPIEIDSSGIYAFEVKAGPWVGGDLSKIYDFNLSINGAFVSRKTINIKNTSTNSFQILTPWLSPGTQTLRIEWDNSFLRREIAIHEVSVFQATGVDSDNSGKPDWTEIRVARQNGIDTVADVSEQKQFLSMPTSFQSNSRLLEQWDSAQQFWSDGEADPNVFRQEYGFQLSAVSPACVEGRGRFPTLIKERTNAVGPVRIGPNDTWYLDIPLDAAYAAGFTLDFENRAASQSHAIFWVPTNVIESEEILIREGDALLLAGWGDSEAIAVQKCDISINGQLFPDTMRGEPLEYSFPQAGTYQIDWGLKEGPLESGYALEGTVMVEVAARPSMTSPDCVVGFERSWEVTNLHPAALVQIDRDVEVWDGAEIPGGFSYRILMEEPVTEYAVTRLDYDGPILANVPIQGVWVETGRKTLAVITEQFADGSQRIAMPIYLPKVSDDVVVKVELIRAGVVFEDGSQYKEISGAEFDEFGYYMMEFFVPDEDTTNCHRLSLWQDGQMIGYIN